MADDQSALVGTKESDSLTGTDGDDVIVGGKGDDTLEGGAGSDILLGGQGDDTFIYDLSAHLGTDEDVYHGGIGNDTVIIRMTAAEAANLALECNVGLLALTHYSPRYENGEDIITEARSVFQKSIIARDFMRIHLDTDGAFEIRELEE